MITFDEAIDIIGTFTNRDECGRHFTERYSDDALADLQDYGLIVIARPIHVPTGIPYDRSYWSAEVTERGLAYYA